MEYSFEEINVRVDNLQKAIEGDHNKLRNAFCWYITPQGSDYWNSQYTGEKELQVEVLKDMLEQYKEWLGPDLEPTIYGYEEDKMEYNFEEMDVSEESLQKAIEGDREALSDSFYWSRTPQGNSYWNSQSIGRKELQVKVLKDMLEQYKRWLGVSLESSVDDKTSVVDRSDNPLKVQYGGSHYKSKAIQPIEYILANDLGFCEGNVVKYVSRYKDKGGVEDLKKARHYIDFLIEELGG